MECFVYGTLTSAERADRVLDDWSFLGPARLEGLHRVDGAYPSLAPGGTVDGRLLRTPEVAVLDDYEGVDHGLYVRVALPVDGSGGTDVEDEVQLYVGTPEELGLPDEWPGDGGLDSRIRRYCRQHEVQVAPL